jgi:hypothetical protein
MLTLADRFTESRLTVSDAVRISSLIAEELRTLHDSGHIHGALCPRNIELHESGVVLHSGEMDASYAAPEGAVQVRSDIFSFGVIVFEMFLGRRPEGAESTGSPAVDRVVLPCLSADPKARPARMQKVILELRLLKMAARKAAAAASARRTEARLTARLDAQERAIADMRGSVEEAVALLRGQVTATEAVRTQIAQTDVVVERMVEALEALQRAVLNRESSDSTVAVN